ncbi:hypothetical protein MTBSS4_70078 [Magnetospirillum sp. SS-4]|nr:hypothetical protein MTBSS4_70078 [Magnetospirillum sp. SS-4]
MYCRRPTSICAASAWAVVMYLRSVPKAIVVPLTGSVEAFSNMDQFQRESSYAGTGSIGYPSVIAASPIYHEKGCGLPRLNTISCG